MLAVVGLLVAVGLSLPASWFDLGGGREQSSRSAYVELPPAPPVRLSLAGLGLTTPLLSSDVEPRDVLRSGPADAPLVTWWNASAEPGASSGQTTLIAHASAAGGGLSGMADLAEGDVVDLLTEQGTMRYEISSLRTFDPATMERVAITLFKQDGGAGRLVMISAEDWDGSAYQRTVVATAVPLGGLR